MTFFSLIRWHSKKPLEPHLTGLIFGKACHLLMELEHKAMWRLKKLNLNWADAANLSMTQLNEMYEFRFQAYESASMYK